MKIRSITYFLNPGWPLREELLDEAGRFIKAAAPAFAEAGYEVQTARMATVPFPHLFANGDLGDAVELAKSLEVSAKVRGYDYVSLGPAIPEVPESYQIIPDVIESTESVFLAGEMASLEKGVSLPAVRACAQVIHRTATTSANGFNNLYFAALANVRPGSPFFPAAYHHGGPPTFALATEAANLAVNAFSSASNLNGARQNLSTSIETHGRALAQVSRELVNQFGISFGGIDFSLAPFPEMELSLGTAVERMGVPAVGFHGSLTAAAILTDAIDRADFPRAGFSGLFMPVMEDTVLARRAEEELLSVKDLLLYSAVCGTGLDTVPLAGDVSPGELAALLLDLATLAQRLNKPLTARLLPIPGKSAGDLTDFDFYYFANSRVMPLSAKSLDAHLMGDETFRLSQLN
jgi:uncharacterized protein (UPF0210 family)